MRIKRLNPGFENVKGESNTLNDGVTSEGMGVLGGEPCSAMGQDRRAETSDKCSCTNACCKVGPT